MTFQTLTLADLCLSPLNVRTNTEDAEATAALEASIAARGLLFPLLVHPFARFGSEKAWPKLKRIHGEPKHAFGTTAGGRRLRAIRKLVEAGRLPADWPIDCVVRDVEPAQITELSLAENLLRRELRPYEVHAAIARANAQGATVAEIAANIGQTERAVARNLRLGNLTPEIFAAYAAGQLDAEQAQVYAATEDVALQRAAWKHFGGAAEARWRNQHEIRKWLKVGDFELARLLRFVGLEAYRAAGGTFELDLFYEGPEDRGRIEHEDLLRGLAETRLEELRDDVRNEFGLPELRFLPAKPELSLFFEPGDLIPPAVVAHLEIGTNSQAELTWWWESKKARATVDRAATGPGDGPSPNFAPVERSRDTQHIGSGLDPHTDLPTHQRARAVVKDEHGLTADGLHALRSIRREILRAVLVADAHERGAHDYTGHLGRDYLIWAQLRQELGGERSIHTGARGLASAWTGSDEAEPKDFVGSLLAETEASVFFETALAIVAAEPFMTEPDAAISLALYVACDEKLKNLAAAVLAGQSLLRSVNTPAWRIPVHDKLAELAGVDAHTIRKAWSPTPAFMALFPRLKRLEHAAPFIDPKILAEWAKKPDKIITAATAAALDPKTHSDPAIARAAGEWVHELLRFQSSAAEQKPAHPEEPAQSNTKGPLALSLSKGSKGTPDEVYTQIAEFEVAQ